MADVPAVMLSPEPGSMLPGSAVTFVWNAGQGSPIDYAIEVGTTLGGHEIAWHSTLGLSDDVTGIPTDGSTIYVRLWTHFAGGSWLYNDYMYTAYLTGLTIAAVKGLAEKWTPVILFDVVLNDGVPRWWAKRSAVFAGHSYEAVIKEHDPLKVEGESTSGIDTIVDMNFHLNNADANLTAVLTADNMRGGRVTPKLVFQNPLTGAMTSDSRGFPPLIIDASDEYWPVLSFSAQNKYNLLRKTLPLSKITRHDRYPFPANAAQRTAGSTDPASPFWPLGYDPDLGHGNYLTPPPNPTYYTTYDGTREQLEVRGLSTRFGGFGNLPPSIVAGGKERGSKQVYAGDANEAKYGAVVPLLYGIVRVSPPVLATGYPQGGAYRFSHLLLGEALTGTAVVGLGSGDNEGCVEKVMLPQNETYQDIPQTSSDPGVTGSWSADHGQMQPYRNLQDSDWEGNFKGADKYSGLAVLYLGLPKEFANIGSQHPQVDVIAHGLPCRAYSGGSWQTPVWTQNPVWIFIDMLLRLRWEEEEIEGAAAQAAAAFCDATITNADDETVPRFRANVGLVAETKAADVLRGVRNCARLYTTYNNQGQLQIKVKGTVAQEGGLKFSLDGATLLRDQEGRLQVKKYHKRITDTPNVFTASFQNEKSLYVQDSIVKMNLDLINTVSQQIDSSSVFPVVGLPSFDQASRILEWANNEFAMLNEYYAVRASLALCENQVGELGTITDAANGLDGQQCRIVSLAVMDDAVELVLKKHSDAIYNDLGMTTPALRALMDSTYSPRSVGGYVGGPSLGKPLVTEIFQRDDTNIDLYVRKIRVKFTPPPVAFAAVMGRTILSNVQVLTTGGSIAHGQTFFIEVCPTLDGVEGLASNYLMVRVPDAGGDTYRFMVDVDLAADADGWVLRLGDFPGQCYRHSSGSQTGKFTLTITAAVPLTDTSLSPDPAFDHALIFYAFDSDLSNIIYAGATAGPAQDAFSFQPSAPETGVTQIKVWVLSSNKAETDFYPFAAAPWAVIDVTSDSGNPSGESNLVLKTHEDDAAIPVGQMVFELSKAGAANWDSVMGVMYLLSTEAIAEGPYKVQRDAHASHQVGGVPFVIESGYCLITAGSPVIQVCDASGNPITRTSDSRVVKRPLVVFTNDASPDSDLEGNNIEAQDVNGFVTDVPFNKGGTAGVKYSYCVLRRWWDTALPDTTNAFAQWFLLQDLTQGGNQDLIDTPRLPSPAGLYYGHAMSRNAFGVGTLLSTASAKTLSVVEGVPPITDTGNPAGASGLTILTNAEDPTIPGGCAVFQFNRDTVNFSSVTAILIALTNFAPAVGPYSVELAAHPTAQIEPTYPAVWDVAVNGTRVDITGRSTPNPGNVEGRPLIIYDPAGRDTTIDGNNIAVDGDHGSYIEVDSPFYKSGNFKGLVLKRFFDVLDSGNTWVNVFPVTREQIGEAVIWRTAAVPVPTGSFYVTGCARNAFGLGTRMTYQMGGAMAQKTFRGLSDGYVQNLAPTNAPTFYTASSTQLSNGNYRIDVWLYAYSQGINTASGIEAVLRWGTSPCGVPDGTGSDSLVTLGLPAQTPTLAYSFEAEPTKHYRVGFRAFSIGADGKRHYTSIVATNDIQPATTVDFGGRLVNSGAVVSWDYNTGNSREVFTWIARVTITAPGISSTYPHFRTTQVTHGLGFSPVAFAWIDTGYGLIPLQGVAEITDTGTYSALPYNAGVVTGAMTATAGECGVYTIGRSDATWAANQWAGRIVRITSGTGAGQIRAISSNNGTTLTVSTAWTTTPTSSSVFQIENGSPAALFSVDSTYLKVHNRSDVTLTVKIYLCKEPATF